MKLIWKRGFAVSMALALLISAFTAMPAAETTRPDTIMGGERSCMTMTVPWIGAATILATRNT